MHAAHHVDLAEPRRRHLLAHLLERQLVGVVVTQLGGEIAEVTGQHADVGRIDLSVEHERGERAGAPFLGGIGETAEGQDVRGFEERQAVALVEPASFGQLVGDALQGGIGAADHRTLPGLGRIRRARG